MSVKLKVFKNMVGMYGGDPIPSIEYSNPNTEEFEKYMRYRIIAYGPEKECLTWANDANLVQTKQRLKEEGYNEITEEEE